VGFITRRQLNEAEFESILRVTEKYLLSKPSPKLAPFTFSWLLELHREMLGSIRGEYIAAMKRADLLNYGPLIDLHKKVSEHS
jgi:hypothetical protein